MKFSTPLFFLLLFAATTVLYSQPLDYHPGQIIENDGTVIQGLLGLDDIVVMSSSVYLKKGVNGEVTRYLPNEIRSASYDTINLKLESIDYDTYDRVTKEVTKKPRLGQLIFKSELFDLIKVELAPTEYEFKYIPAVSYVYYLRDKRKNDVFLLNIEEKIESSTNYKVRKNYLGALKFALNDWESSASRVEQMNFDDRGMVKLLTDYHAALPSPQPVDYIYELDIVKQKKQQKRVIEFGASAPLWKSPWQHGTNFSFGYFKEYKKPLGNSRVSNRLGLELSFIDVIPDENQAFQLDQLALLKLNYSKLRSLGKGGKDFEVRFRWGASTYLHWSQNRILTYQNFQLADGTIERRVVNTEKESQMGLYPITIDLGFNLRYRRVYLDTFSESFAYRFLNKEHGLFNVLGLRLGFYLK